MNGSEQSRIPGAPVPATEPTTPVKFRFVKSESFRSIYIMSAWGRINPNNDIVLSLYQEIEPLALSATYEKQADGSWKPGSQTLELPPDYQMVRQVEADIILPLEAAKRIHQVLAIYIQAASQRILAKGQPKAKQPEPSKVG